MPVLGSRTQGGHGGNGTARNGEEMEKAKQQMSKRKNLETLFEYTFASNNAMVVQVVRDREPKNEHKAGHWCFLSLIPGYDHEKKITLKIEPEKMMAIADAIRRVANGHSGSIGGKFEVYADPTKAGVEGFKKTLAVEPGRDPDKPQAVVIFSEKGQAQGGAKGNFGQLFLSPPNAYGLSQVLEFTGRKALELEFERQRESSWRPGQEQHYGR